DRSPTPTSPSCALFPYTTLFRSGAAHGLDPKTLSAMMAVSTSRSWATEVCNPWPGVIESAPASRGYTGGFGNDLMLKDLGLAVRSEEHTSELQSRENLVCRLLLE